MRALAIAAMSVMLGSSAFGASTVIPFGSKRVIYLHTGSAGGSCVTKTVQGGVEETVCRDRDNVAAASTSAGCLDSNGGGYCAIGRPHATGDVGSQLTCASGAAYYLVVGPKARCRVSDNFKACSSPDGDSTAEADCETGCLKTTGAGSCCSEGAGCPPATTELKQP